MKVNLSEYSIEITEDVMNIFRRHQQIKRVQNEAGGILFCQKTRNELYINKVSTPNKFDTRSRFQFIRHKDAAQVIIDFEFINSGGKSTYIGEWHTHPEDHPTPSEQDKKMISDQFKKSKLNEPFVLLIIVGLKSLFIQLYDNNINSCLTLKIA